MRTTQNVKVLGQAALIPSVVCLKYSFVKIFLWVCYLFKRHFKFCVYVSGELIYPIFLKKRRNVCYVEHGCLPPLSDPGLITVLAASHVG